MEIMSANIEKYYKAITDEAKPPQESTGAGFTVKDLESMETRINTYINESIERLETKLAVATKQNNETPQATETPDNEEKGE